MASLYEELLQSAPHQNIKKESTVEHIYYERKKKLKEDKQQESLEEDKLHTPEEIKEIKRQQRLKEKYRKQTDRDQWLKEKREALYGIEIGRRNVYLGEDFWKEMSIAMQEAKEKEEGKDLDTSYLYNICDEKDYNYILENKADWCRGTDRRFAIDWFQGTIPKSNVRRKVRIGSPIRVINTYSANHIYGYLLKVQENIYLYLKEFADKYSLTVENYVRANYNPEDYHQTWKQHKGLYRPIEYATKGSWLDAVTKGVQVRLRRYIFYYIKIIYEGKFMLSEVCLPFTTYISGDYVYLGSNGCMVVSLTGNGELFNEENRKLVHQWGVMASVPTKKYVLFDRIPLFYGEDMRMVKVPISKITEDDGTIHNCGQYALYIVPTGGHKGENILTTSTTMEWVQQKFNAPTYDECLIKYSDWKPKYPTWEIPMSKSIKKNVLYYDDSDE